MTHQQMARDGPSRRAAHGLGACLLGALLAISFAYPPVARADTGQWSKPAAVSPDVDGWWPNVVADRAGNVHLVWRGEFPDRPLHMSALYYSRWDGGGWSKPNDIALLSVGGGGDPPPASSLAVDPNGRLHLMYRGFGPQGTDTLGQESLWHAVVDGARAGSASSWQAATQLVRSGYARYSDIAIDSRGVAHSIWTEEDGWGCGIYYTRSADGGATWSGRVSLDAVNLVSCSRAQLEVDGQDRLHAVWELTDTRLKVETAGVIRGMAYATSKDGGKTWSKARWPDTPILYPAKDSSEQRPKPGPQQPAVGVDGKGNVLLVYREPTGNQIFCLVSADGERWAPPSPVPGVKAGVARLHDAYDMATDSAGHVHLAMVAYPADSDTMSLLHAEWDGQNWAKVSTVASSPPFPEYPRLAVSEGNRLHVVWLGGDGPNIDRASLGIWHSTAQTTAPAVARQIAAAPAAASATPSTTPQPTPPPVRDLGTVAEPESGPRVGTTLASHESLGDLGREPAYPLLLGAASVIPLLAAMLGARLAASSIADLRRSRRS